VNKAGEVMFPYELISKTQVNPRAMFGRVFHPSYHY